MMNTFKLSSDEEKQIKIVGGQYVAITNKGPGAAFISENPHIKSGNIGVTCVEPGTTEYMVLPINYEYVKEIDKFEYISRVYATTSKGETVTMECAGATNRSDVMTIIHSTVDTSEYQTEDSEYEWAIYSGCLWSDPDGEGVHKDEVNTESITEWFTKSNSNKVAPVTKSTDKSGAVKCGGNNGFPIFMWDARMGDCKQILNAISADSKSDFVKYTVTINEVEYIAYVQNGTADMTDDTADFTIVF